MPIIKFSHPYTKLHHKDGNIIKTAFLVAVTTTNLEDLPLNFKRWDTDDFTYNLPVNGKFLILTFWANHHSHVSKSHCFTTLRPWSAEKEEFYQKMLNKRFDVVLTKS